MKLIVDSTNYNIWDKDVPDEVVGYNFYSIGGGYIGRFLPKSDNYPRANYKLVIKINGITIELLNTQNLYITDDGKYFVGREL